MWAVVQLQGQALSATQVGIWARLSLDCRATTQQRPNQSRNIRLVALAWVYNMHTKFFTARKPCCRRLPGRICPEHRRPAMSWTSGLPRQRQPETHSLRSSLRSASSCRWAGLGRLHCGSRTTLLRRAKDVVVCCPRPTQGPLHCFVLHRLLQAGLAIHARGAPAPSVTDAPAGAGLTPAYKVVIMSIFAGPGGGAAE